MQKFILSILIVLTKILICWTYLFRLLWYIFVGCFHSQTWNSNRTNKALASVGRLIEVWMESGTIWSYLNIAQRCWTNNSTVLLVVTVINWVGRWVGLLVTINRLVRLGGSGICKATLPGVNDCLQFTSRVVLLFNGFSFFFSFLQLKIWNTRIQNAIENIIKVKNLV